MEVISEISDLLRQWVSLLFSAGSELQNLQICTLVAASADLRQLSVTSVLLRLFLAAAFGGFIGLERGRKNRPAGIRTYMVVCIGATLTMILGQYEAHALETLWAAQAGIAGTKTDITRFGAQVINGIGFLGAGTILITGRQQIKGLTTAASLWASACMGLALGAGFYECAILSFGLIMVATWFLPKIEAFLMEKARNMNIYVEFTVLDGINEVISCLKTMNIQIYDVDIERDKKSQLQNPNAVFSIRLAKHQARTQVLAALSQLDNIRIIKEI